MLFYYADRLAGEGRDPDYHAPVIGFTSDPFINSSSKSNMADMITQGGEHSPKS